MKPNHRPLSDRLASLLVVFLVTFITLPVNAGVGSVGGFDDEEPLMPDQAFALSTKVIDANTVRAEWIIADKYYLYRNKFKFISKTEGVSTNPGVYPKGEIHEDEFFGKVETYRGKVAIDIPLNRTGNAKTLVLDITSQGCADMGICYPPQKQTVSFKLPAMAGAPAAEPPSTKTAKPESSFNPLQTLKNFGSSLGLLDSNDDFLPPEQAFTFSAEALDGNTIRVHWDIVDDVYLYQNKFKFKLKDANGITLGQPTMPEGKTKVDEYFGKMVVYYHEVTLDIPLTRTNLDPTDVILVATSQGCADAGFCYPPLTQEMPVSLPAASTNAETSPSNNSEDNRSYIGNLLFAFGIGLLLTFTPCVLPMIPILVGAIVGQSDKAPSKMRAGVLSGSYVMGTAVTYSVAGWLAGASGQQLQAYTQNAWAIGTVAAILVVLSLSMFGFFQLQMPSFVQSLLQTKSQNVKGGSMFGTFFLGLISALIVGACVTPLLMLVLGIAIQAGDPVLGASMMFAMAMGMGVILVMVGVGAGHLLPKAGMWMDTIKYIFGALLIGVAIYLLTPLQGVPILLLWGIFFIVCGVYMGATQNIPEGSSNWRSLWKGLGIVVLIWGVLALVGSVFGNRDVMQPMDMSHMSFGGSPGTATQSATVDPHDLFIQLHSTDDLDRELAKAKAAGKAVLLDYYATWCTDCRRMEKATFAKPAVQKILRDKFVMLQVDVEDPNNAKTEAIKKRYKVFGPPAMLFFDTH
ncbi:MAG: protein-disulfide reductase DsbD, partial [Gammaproteobacteria bacterium]